MSISKTEKEKFTAELVKLEDEFDERKAGTFTGGPGMVQAIQSMAVKKLVTLLCRILLASN